MTDNVLYGIDFSAKRERDHAQFLIAMAISQALAPDAVFVDETPTKAFIEWRSRKYPELADFVPMSIEERVRRSIYHGLPYPKDSA